MSSFRWRRCVWLVPFAVACGGETSTTGSTVSTPGAGGTAGQAGASAGSGLAGSTGGVAGASGGAAGVAGGAAGVAGSAGAQAGSAGAQAGGAGAKAGSAGAQAGSAGAKAGGAGTAGTAGGTGGAMTACSAPVLEAGPLGMDPGFDTRREGSPVLVDGGDAATLVYHWTSQPGGTVYGTRTLPFDAWGAWPSLLGPGKGANFVLQLEDRIVASSVGAGKVAVVTARMATFDPKPAWRLEVTAPVDPAVGDGTPLLVAPEVILQKVAVRFVVETPNGQVVGWQRSESDPSLGGIPALEAARVVGTTVTPLDLAAAACSTGELVADAAPLPGGLVVAHATGRLCCQCDDGVDGPPTMAVVRALPGSVGVENVLPTTAPTAPITWMRTVARGDGNAWVLVERDTGTPKRLVELALVGADGLAVGPVVTLPSEVTLGHHPVLAALGDRLLVADLQGQVGSEATVALSVVEGTPATGVSVDSHAFPTGFPWREDVPSVLVRKNAEGTFQVVVAFSHEDAKQPMFEERIHLVRYALACP